MIDVCLQRVSSHPGQPTDDDFARWVQAVLQTTDQPPSCLTIRIVDLQESRSLNARFRDKDKPTNVLSFPAPPVIAPLLQDARVTPELGDLVVCAPLVEQEAAEQSKLLNHHWAHLVIHGVLHLLGYDHIAIADAEVMEAREVEILGALGIGNPY